MARLPLLRAALGLWSAGVFLACDRAASAQAPKGDEIQVQFETADKVELHGTFYPSGKTKAPCVILLHNIGGNRQQKGWAELAKALSKDFAVLSFDFRGHGDSTNVAPAFWKTTTNTMIKGAAKMPSKISYKDFPDAYFPMLANDVVAAKRYLEQQNDSMSCNASNIVVIGAQDGAAVGALWVMTEWQKKKMTKNQFNVPVYDPQGRVEGEDIAAAVWLSIPRKSKYLRDIDVGYWLKGPGNKIRDKVPMVFFYGKKDQAATTAANALLNELKRAGKDKLELTTTREKDTNLAGADLLANQTLNTEEEISTYLVEKVLPRRGAKPWVMREPDKAGQFGLIPLYNFGFNLR
jgi:pimeloyl-ACP methyl ester carboxylesterase